jgi:hypothetical protein
VRWETLQDPQDGSLLLTDEQLYFSRYLSSLDWRPVGVRSKGDLTALVAIANPTNLSAYRPDGRPLAPVDVEAERRRAETGLGGIPVTVLGGGAAQGRVTLGALTAHLREGRDILYLVCHGALREGEPYLWLEDDTGAAEVVAGQELATRIRELEQRPRLVVLASCQSAGAGGAARSEDGGVLAALGPRLAEAGVPAVLAMQGDVSAETVARFMPVFFRELQRDGQIDRATAVARGAVRERPDWWAPALFMRLKSGRAWYEPGFADRRAAFERWPALLRRIREGRCTPILGSGVLEWLIGSPQDIARRWAERYQFPMAPAERERLPDVAQYLAVNAGEYDFPRRELVDYLRRELARRHYGGALPERLRDQPLDALLTDAWRQARGRRPTEPHRVLANLPFRIFITTNPDSLLEEALKEAGKDPVRELCQWREDLEPPPSVYDERPDYEPSAERPLVYHLFGHLSQPDSIVLGEDDYFDYLIGVTGNQDLVPKPVQRARTDSALLFLGFQLDDWDFRVLFRSIMKQPGQWRRKRYAHVAAQINPEGGRILEPERGRRYLESYFEGVDVSIYWGSSEEFLAELAVKWAEYAAGGSAQ